MPDVHSVAVRSYNMSRIRGSNTKPELLVRKFLFSKGLRFRLHVRSLPGKPDIVLPKYKCAIFVNGCFWHGHKNCRYFVLPKTRTKWWHDKIQRNKQRDLDNLSALLAEGWFVETIFECALRGSEAELNLERLLKRIIHHL
jgi:DNA mismatch endonuclease, patch repair protein